MSKAKREKNEKGKAWLRRELSPYRSLIAVLSVLAVCIALASVAFAYLVRYLIDAAAEKNGKQLLFFGRRPFRPFAAAYFGADAECLSNGKMPGKNVRGDETKIVWRSSVRRLCADGTISQRRYVVPPYVRRCGSRCGYDKTYARLVGRAGARRGRLLRALRARSAVYDTVCNRSGGAHLPRHPFEKKGEGLPKRGIGSGRQKPRFYAGKPRLRRDIESLRRGAKNGGEIEAVAGRVLRQKNEESPLPRLFKRRFFLFERHRIALCRRLVLCGYCSRAHGITERRCPSFSYWDNFNSL